MKKLMVLFFTFVFLNFEASAQFDKDKVFESIKSEFSKLNTISLDFVLNDNDAVKGHLTAKKGNKYILSIAGRKIISDGENIWNYIPANKNVIISKFDLHSESVSIESIFFEFTSNFKPSKLYKNQRSDTKSSHILELIPAGKTDNEISMIKLALNPDSIEIKGITLVRNYTEESWDIKNLKLNPTIADNKFGFSAPDNVEIIDLR